MSDDTMIQYNTLKYSFLLFFSSFFSFLFSFKIFMIHLFFCFHFLFYDHFFFFLSSLIIRIATKGFMKNNQYFVLFYSSIWIFCNYSKDFLLLIQTSMVCIAILLFNHIISYHLIYLLYIYINLFIEFIHKIDSHCCLLIVLISIIMTDIPHTISSLSPHPINESS